MLVKFSTNIDAYKKDCFPHLLTIPPRVGEKVMVKSDFKSYFLEKRLPISLEVVGVTWYED